MREKSAERARLRFVDCTVRNAANDRGYGGVWAPVAFNLTDPQRTAKVGGVDFVDCVIEDDLDRPALVVEGMVLELGIFDITGTIIVKNPCGLKYNLGEKQTGVTLAVKESSD